MTAFACADVGEAPAAEASAGADDTESASAAGEDAATRIEKAFLDLGAKEGRARCYGETLTDRLEGETLEEAVRIVETAQSDGDVRKGVLSGGLSIIGAFSDAKDACGGGE